MIYATLTKDRLLFHNGEKLHKEFDEKVKNLTILLTGAINKLEADYNNGGGQGVKKQLETEKKNYELAVDYEAKKYLAENGFIPISESFFYLPDEVKKLSDK